MTRRPAVPSATVRPSRLPAWVGFGEGDLNAAAVDSISIDCLFGTASYAVTRWFCRDSPHDSRREKAQGAYVLAFPHEGSFRVSSRAGAALVGANEMAVFARGLPYQTDHPCGCGDHGSAICLSDEAAAALAEEWGVRIRSDGALPLVSAPVSASIAAERARLMRDLRHGAIADALEFDERVTALLSSPATGAAAADRVRGPAREAVDAVRATIQRDGSQTARLSDLARSVGLSTFNLCRLFKRVTGATIGGYRARLRVQAAWSRLLDDPRQDLTALALDLGFSSHSRFTAVFRRYLGFTPSAMRPSGWSPGSRCGRRRHASP